MLSVFPASKLSKMGKTLAERFCNGLLKDGTLVPVHVQLFSDFARDWWEWDRCSYIQGKLKRSRAGKPTISRAHADDMHAALERHVLPSFKYEKLEDITVPAI
jgi:hypothetical protein